MLPGAADTGLLGGSDGMRGRRGGHSCSSTASFKVARRVSHLWEVGRQITAEKRRFCHHFAGREMCCGSGRGLRILLETGCEVGLGREWGLGAIAVSLVQ